jgi:peptidoglycan/LPS O-acetylase OafA/YrhL
MSSDRNFLPQLDGVRAISIAMVLALHCVRVPDESTASWLVRHSLSIGWAGVDLFFALSGFLITRILLRSRSDPHYFRNFYARRFLRIFPLYYGVLAFLWLGGWSLFQFGPIEVAWPYFGYLSNFYIVFSPPGWPPLGHTWSLAIEEQYYLVFPAVVLLASRLTLSRLLWVVVVVSPLIRIFTYQSWPEASHSLTQCRLDVLAMGGLAGMYLDDGRAERGLDMRRLKLAFYLLMTVMLAMFVSKLLDFRGFWHNLIGLSVVDATAALFVLLAAVSAWGPMDRFLRLAPIRALGKVSYCVYLLHFPIVYLTRDLLGSAMAPSWFRTGAEAVVSISATLLLAAISWSFFEKPMLSLKRHFADPAPVLPPAAAVGANVQLRAEK